MYTDPKRVRADIPGTVEGNPVFMYHDAFNPESAEVEDLKARYRAGKVGDVEVKTKLAKALNAHLDPMRARRADVLAKPGDVREILDEGSKKGARRSRRRRWNASASAVKLQVLTGTRTWSYDPSSNRSSRPIRSGSRISRARSICCCT